MVCFEKRNYRLWYDLCDYMGENFEKFSEYFPPKDPKLGEVTMVKGIKCVHFRLDKADAEGIFGSEYLPIMSSKDPLFWKILQYRHRPPSASGINIHDNEVATCAQHQRGPFCLTTSKMQKIAASYINTCYNCMIPA